MFVTLRSCNAMKLQDLQYVAAMDEYWVIIKFIVLFDKNKQTFCNNIAIK